MLDTDIKPEIILERLSKVAEFTRSVLHLPFPDMEKVNPSFSLLSKYCDFIASLLEESQDIEVKIEGVDTGSKALHLAKILKEIAEAIVDRSDQIIIDCMCEIDQYLDDTRSKVKLHSV
jgi:methylaspartate ammonia-lyase